MISFDAELVSMSGFGSHFVFASFEFLMRVRKYVRLVPGVFFLRVFEAVGLLYVRFDPTLFLRGLSLVFLLAFGKGEY